jgi:hypothetical protein
MVKFKNVRYKNFLSYGNAFTEIWLDYKPTTVLIGESGSGKCVDPLTEIEILIEDKKVLKDFRKMKK